MKLDKDIINFKKYLVKNQISGIALDIDETLSDTSGSWVQVFFDKFGNPENFSCKEFSKKYRSVDSAPYFQTQDCKDLIGTMAVNPEYYSNLDIIENSDCVVNQINKIIPIVAYITARPFCIFDTTQKWLQEKGFPKAKIITRSEDVSFKDSNKWKAQVIEYLYPQIIGIIDDNKSIVDNLSPNYSGKIIIFGDSSCPTWDCVLDKIKL